MRRADRQVTDISKIKEVVDNCKVCRLGLNDNSEVYIVPLNFGYILENNRLELYFHCAPVGRKIDILKSNPHVGFEMDSCHKLMEAEAACGYSYQYASIIGKGTASFVEDSAKKAEALQIIMKHQSGKTFEFTEKMTKAVTVIQVIAEDFTCKKNM